MLTSYSAKGSGTGIPRNRGLTLDAEDYLEKPISPKDLLATVANYLEKA
jgi:DNA-binding response OmpR family regulator